MHFPDAKHVARQSSSITGLISGILIAVLVVISYSNSLDSPFLFDDFQNIVGNRSLALHDLSFASLKQAATAGPSSNRLIPNLTFALNYFFDSSRGESGYHATGGPHQGLADGGSNVRGYHLVNLGIHILAAWSFFLLACITLARPIAGCRHNYPWMIALVAALVWAVHPVQTSAVTYVVQRMTSLAALFSFLTLLLYAHGRRQEPGIKRKIHFVGAIFTGGLAVGSKENAAMLPAMVIAYELFFIGGIDKGFWKNRLRLGAIAAAVLVFLGLCMVYLGTDPLDRILQGYAKRDFTLGERLLTEPRVIIHYLSLLLLPLPSRLNLAYDFPVSTGLLSPPATILALAGLFLLAGVAWKLYSRNRLASFAIFWFLGNLLIESSVIGLELVFEHRLYLPAAFLMLSGVAWGASLLNKRNITAIFVAAAIVSSLVFFTWQRNETWSSRETIWADVAAKSPKLSRGYLGLYMFYQARGRYEEAKQNLMQAVALDPQGFLPSYNLANLYLKEKNYKEALRVLNRMLGYRSDKQAKLYLLRADIYMEIGNYPFAIRDSQAALRDSPGNVEALQSLGAASFKAKDYTKALDAYQLLEKQGILTASLFGNLGLVLFNLGRVEQAIDYYRKALAIEPDNVQVHYNLGLAYGSKGMVDEAFQEMTFGRRQR